MTFEQFEQSTKGELLPPNLSGGLQSLWHDAKKDWEAAHNIAQDMNNDTGAWIHAYLHRKEGDRWNANYWYQRAGRSFPAYNLEEEWEVIARTLCE